MFKVGYTVGARCLQREFAALDEAVAFFEYLVYQDGQSLSVSLMESGSDATLGTWDAGNGVMWSPSDRRAADVSSELRQRERAAAV